MSKQKEVFGIIKSLTGQANILTVPRVFVDYTGNLECALLLSQLLYWCDKGNNKEGWIYKTYKEWNEEICLTEYAVRKSARKLVKMGILETKVKKANGNPTVHYKLLPDKLETSFLRFQRNETEKTKERNCENKVSLTETTTETTSKTTLKDIRVLPGATRNSPISYDEYNFTSADKKEIVAYYIKTYSNYMNKQHPKLKPSQWKRVDSGLESIYNKEIDVSFDSPEVDEWKQMIDKHFETEYENCDYNILHFITDGVKIKRMYETIY